MATKFIQDLVSGDRVALEEGSATITKVGRCRIMDAAPKMGGAYEVIYKDDGGESGQMIVAGMAQVELA